VATTPAIATEVESHIRRPPAAVYAFVVEDFFHNYPRWSPQVEQLRQITPGPLQTGTRGYQVRVDQGRRTESEFVVERLIRGEAVTFTGIDYPYRITYAVEPVAGGSRLRFRFELLEMSRVLRPFSGLVRRIVERTTTPVADDIRGLIEAEVEPGEAQALAGTLPNGNHGDRHP
jgi:hypothetical protein